MGKFQEQQSAIQVRNKMRGIQSKAGSHATGKRGSTSIKNKNISKRENDKMKKVKRAAKI
jgi:hypothetical protein